MRPTRSCLRALGCGLAGIVALSCSDRPEAVRGPGPFAAPDAAPGAQMPTPLDACGDRQGLALGAPWPVQGGCPKRAGTASHGGSQQAAVQWSLRVPGTGSSPVVDAMGRVWIGTSEGLVRVSRTGVVDQEFVVEGGVLSAPAILASEAVAAVGANGVLYGVSPSEPDSSLDGGRAIDAGADAASLVVRAREVFRNTQVPPLGPLSSPSVAADGTLYVHRSDGSLAALRPGSADTAWLANTGDAASVTALGSDGTVYGTLKAGSVFAVGNDGVSRWTFALGAEPRGYPAIGPDGALYVACATGKLVKLTPDGTLAWELGVGGPLSGSPAVGSRGIYVGSEDSTLYAVDPTSGRVAWSYATYGAVGPPLVDSAERIYVGSADGNLYAMEPSGRLFFAVRLGSPIVGSLALGADGTLFASTERALVAVGP